MGRIRFAVWLALAASLISLPTLAADRALLVGVGRYSDPAVPWLFGIDEDLAMMRKAALELGFEENQTKVLADSGARLEDVVQAMEEFLIAGTAPRDRVLIYFSGHGSQIKDESGDEPDGVDEVLICHDTWVNGRTLAKGLVDDDFGAMLDRVPAARVLVLIDACHSGTATRGLTTPRDGMRPKYFKYKGMPISGGGFLAKGAAAARPGLVVLSAAQDTEKAISSQKGSFFTRGVFEAVTRASAQGRPLSMRALQEEARKRIFSLVDRPEAVHHPNLSGDEKMSGADIFRDKDSRVWNEIEARVHGADFPVDMRLDRDQYSKGDKLFITCRVDNPGYLNVINVSKEDGRITVLFPNRFHENNYVPGGGLITLPEQGQGFDLKARDLGGVMVAVFLTRDNINFFRQGIGKSEDVFRILRPGRFRGAFKPGPRSSGAYGAGLAIAVIR